MKPSDGAYVFESEKSSDPTLRECPASPNPLPVPIILDTCRLI